MFIEEPRIQLKIMLPDSLMNDKFLVTLTDSTLKIKVNDKTI